MYCKMPSVAIGIRRAPAANKSKGSAVNGPANTNHPIVLAGP